MVNDRVTGKFLIFGQCTFRIISCVDVRSWVWSCVTIRLLFYLQLRNELVSLNEFSSSVCVSVCD